MPMNPVAVERRCHLIRFFAARGGTLKGVKTKDLAPMLAMPYDQMNGHLRRLEQFGVLEIRRPFIAGQGRLPNEYRLLRDENWFREHADAIEQQFRRQAVAAHHAARKAEEARVDARRATRQAGAEARKEGNRRAKKGLPPTPPPPGVPEPKSKPVSDAFRKQLIEEGMALPASELAKWGA